MYNRYEILRFRADSNELETIGKVEAPHLTIYEGYLYFTDIPIMYDYRDNVLQPPQNCIAVYAIGTWDIVIREYKSTRYDKGVEKDVLEKFETAADGFDTAFSYS